MNCFKCNAENSDNAAFCKKCGSKLLAENICKRCNAENNVGAAFCKKCGESLKAAVTPQNTVAVDNKAEDIVPVMAPVTQTVVADTMLSTEAPSPEFNPDVAAQVMSEMPMPEMQIPEMQLASPQIAEAIKKPKGKKAKLIIIMSLILVVLISCTTVFFIFYNRLKGSSEKPVAYLRDGNTLMVTASTLKEPMIISDTFKVNDDRFEYFSQIVDFSTDNRFVFYLDDYNEGKTISKFPQPVGTLYQKKIASINLIKEEKVSKGEKISNGVVKFFVLAENKGIVYLKNNGKVELYSSAAAVKEITAGVSNILDVTEDGTMLFTTEETVENDMDLSPSTTNTFHTINLFNEAKPTKLFSGVTYCYDIAPDLSKIVYATNATEEKASLWQYTKAGGAKEISTSLSAVESVSDSDSIWYRASVDSDIAAGQFYIDDAMEPSIDMPILDNYPNDMSTGYLMDGLNLFLDDICDGIFIGVDSKFSSSLSVYASAVGVPFSVLYYPIENVAEFRERYNLNDWDERTVDYYRSYSLEYVDFSYQYLRELVLYDNEQKKINRLTELKADIEETVGLHMERSAEFDLAQGGNLIHFAAGKITTEVPDCANVIRSDAASGIAVYSIETAPEFEALPLSEMESILSFEKKFSEWTQKSKTNYYFVKSGAAPMPIQVGENGISYAYIAADKAGFYYAVDDENDSGLYYVDISSGVATGPVASGDGGYVYSDKPFNGGSLALFGENQPSLYIVRGDDSEEIVENCKTFETIENNTELLILSGDSNDELSGSGTLIHYANGKMQDIDEKVSLMFYREPKYLYYMKDSGSRKKETFELCLKRGRKDMVVIDDKVDKVFLNKTDYLGKTAESVPFGIS